ncbi:unnamed protein product, partial [Notodromas monacha]
LLLCLTSCVLARGGRGGGGGGGRGGGGGGRGYGGGGKTSGVKAAVVRVPTVVKAGVVGAALGAAAVPVGKGLVSRGSSGSKGRYMIADNRQSSDEVDGEPVVEDREEGGMTAFGIIALIIGLGIIGLLGYWLLRYWCEIRPIQKRLKHDAENPLLRQDENENVVAGKTKELEAVPLVAYSRRTVNGDCNDDDDDERAQDISPPESVGDFRRGHSNRSTNGSRCSDGGSDRGSVGGGDQDRSSPSVLYPSISAVKKIDEPDHSDDDFLYATSARIKTPNYVDEFVGFERVNDSVQKARIDAAVEN